MESSKRTILEDAKIPVKIKLCALWASLMVCYVYGDYFHLYQPGVAKEILEGRMPPLGAVTQGVLLGTSISMAIPGVMVFLSLVLKPMVNRWANIILGVLYTLFVLWTMPGAWVFYLFLGCVYVVLSALIVWYAWTWPRQEAR